jgi:hypothetical protein
MIPMLDDEGRIILEPEAIIATKEKRLCSRVIKEYLIKWKRSFEKKMQHGSQSTFTSYILPYHCFEDKANFKGRAMLHIHNNNQDNNNLISTKH